MKKSKFTEAQIVFAIRQSDQGVKVEEICRNMGISEATFYNWKKKYSGLGVSELRELRMLKEENSRLKQMVADLSLDKQMLQDVIKKSFEACSEALFGRLSYTAIQNINQAFLSCNDDLPFGILLQISPKGGSASAKPYQGDCRDKDQVWALAGLYPAQA